MLDTNNVIAKQAFNVILNSNLRYLWNDGDLVSELMQTHITGRQVINDNVSLWLSHPE